MHRMFLNNVILLGEVKFIHGGIRLTQDKSRLLSQLQSFARMAHTRQQPKQTSHPLSALFGNFEN